ncbi:hypothetical protein ALC53_08585, partial [Atta colombica]
KLNLFLFFNDFLGLFLIKFNSFNPSGTGLNISNSFILFILISIQILLYILEISVSISFHRSSFPLFIGAMFLIIAGFIH